MRAGPKTQRAIKNNGLSIVLFLLFAVFWTGQAISGWISNNQEAMREGRPTLSLPRYLRSGEFLEATAENWESEFLQMTAFVLLSAALIQRGSAESKKPEADESGTERPEAKRSDVPGPVRRGGTASRLYAHSLSIALFTLFLVSFVAHALGGVAAENSERLTRSEAALSVWQFLGTATFWFQSFQNWQSEFLSVGVLVVLTIFLRERGSPQSKPLGAPHTQTGH